MLGDKFPDYTFVPIDDFILLKSHLIEDKIRNYEVPYNTKEKKEFDIVYYDDYNSLSNHTIKTRFYIKDKCYQSKDYLNMMKEIKQTKGIYIDIEDAEYYSLSLTYDNIQERIKDNKRISDIKKAKSNNRDSIYSMYSKGVMTGFTNGLYKMNRQFKPAEKSTETEAKVWISRVVGKTPLRRFTPDGLLIREGNLPFNHKEWKYILEDVPNEFYKKRYSYEILLSLKDLNIVREEAILPSEFINEYYKWNGIQGDRINHIVENIKKSLETQLNISNKTINESWKDEYWSILGEINDIDNMEIKKIYTDKEGNVTRTVITDSYTVFDRYIEFVKKNKITVKSANIFVDPYGIYIGEKAAYIRCYAKFKVDWEGKIEDVDSLIYPGGYYSSNMSQNNLNGLKKGKYIECLVDVPIDLEAPYEYETPTYYQYAPTGYLKSMKYLTSPDKYYGIVYIKEKQLEIIKYLADPKWDIWNWKWEGMKLN